jgi:Flp pilus assembly pilin Flp
MFSLWPEGMMSTFPSELKAEDGQGLVEYALIIFLVALAAVAGLTAFGFSLAGYYDRILASLPF